MGLQGRYFSLRGLALDVALKQSMSAMSLREDDAMVTEALSKLLSSFKTGVLKSRGNNFRMSERGCEFPCKPIPLKFTDRRFTP